MRPEGAIAAKPYWKPRLARAAGWALLGAVSFLFGWWAVDWLDSLGLDVKWTVGPIGVSLLVLIIGFVYSAALGVAMWRTGHAGRRRAAGFALVAMPWLAFGVNAGNILFWTYTGLPVFLENLLEDFLIWFAALLTAGVWVTLAGLLFLPVLRSRAAVAWLFGASAGFAALAGTIAIADADSLFDALQYVVAAWCAVYAAALSMALPRARRDDGDGIGDETGGAGDIIGNSRDTILKSLRQASETNAVPGRRLPHPSTATRTTCASSRVSTLPMPWSWMVPSGRCQLMI